MAAQMSDAAEIFLRALDEEFECELANHAIHSEHTKYESASDARMAMLRLAYLRGREDEREPFDARDFAADVAKVEAANAAKR